MFASSLFSTCKAVQKRGHNTRRATYENNADKFALPGVSNNSRPWSQSDSSSVKKRVWKYSEAVSSWQRHIHYVTKPTWYPDLKKSRLHLKTRTVDVVVRNKAIISGCATKANGRTDANKQDTVNSSNTTASLHKFHPETVAFTLSLAFWFT